MKPNHPKPDFTVVIPSFKDLRIGETIESINRQDYPRDRIEVVVMDGGSPPPVVDQIARWLRPWDQLISERDKGIFDGINRGIARATGGVILTIGTDDKLAVSDAVTTFMRALADPAVDYACAGVAMTDQDWKPVREWPATMPTLRNFLLGSQINHFSFVCRPSVYQQVGLFDLRYPVAADFDFFLRLTKRGLPGARIPRRLVYMKLGGNSSKNLRNISRGNLEIVRSAFRLYGPLLLLHFMAKPFVKFAQFRRAKRQAPAGSQVS